MPLLGVRVISQITDAAYEDAKLIFGLLAIFHKLARVDNTPPQWRVFKPKTVLKHRRYIDKENFRGKIHISLEGNTDTLLRA